MQTRSAQPKADGSASSPDSSPRVSSLSQDDEDVTLSSPQLIFASQCRSWRGGLRSFAGVQYPALLQTSLTPESFPKPPESLEHTLFSSIQSCEERARAKEEELWSANAKEEESKQAGQGAQSEEGGIICYSPFLPCSDLLARVENLQREHESTQDALAAQTLVLHSYTQQAEVQIRRLKRQEAEAREGVYTYIADTATYASCVSSYCYICVLIILL